MVSPLAIVMLFGQLQAAAVPPPVMTIPPPIEVRADPEVKPMRKAALMSGTIGNADYPALALDKKMQGTVALEIAVSRWGSVSDCTITESSGHAVLDEQTCQLAARRFRFWPALDENAKPTNGSYTRRVVWMLPDDAKPADKAPPRAYIPHVYTPISTFPRAPVVLSYNWNKPTIADYPERALKEKREGMTGIRVNLDARGNATHCMVTASSGSPDLDLKACDISKTRINAEPALDLDGRPTIGVVSASVPWRLPVTPSNDRLPVLYKARDIDPAPRPMPKPADVDISFIVDEKGKIRDCQTTAKGEAGPLRHQAFCETERGARQSLMPAVDEKGKPVSRKVRLRYIVEVGPVDGK